MTFSHHPSALTEVSISCGQWGGGEGHSWRSYWVHQLIRYYGWLWQHGQMSHWHICILLKIILSNYPENFNFLCNSQNIADKGVWKKNSPFDILIFLGQFGIFIKHFLIWTKKVTLDIWVWSDKIQNFIKIRWKSTIWEWKKFRDYLFSPRSVNMCNTNAPPSPLNFTTYFGMFLKYCIFINTLFTYNLGLMLWIGYGQ